MATKLEGLYLEYLFFCQYTTAGMKGFRRCLEPVDEEQGTPKGGWDSSLTFAYNTSICQ
jgi:hypothetical protein